MRRDAGAGRGEGEGKGEDEGESGVHCEFERRSEEIMEADDKDTSKRTEPAGRNEI